MLLNGLIRANYKFEKMTKDDKKFIFIEHVNIINEGIDFNSKTNSMIFIYLR